MLKRFYKKALCMAMASCMVMGIAACGTDSSATISETADDEQISEITVDEGVIVTYRIVDKDASEEDIEDTIDNISRRLKEYSGHCEYVVEDDEITFGIEFDPEEYDASMVVRKLIRHGGLLILDQENYEAWSQGEDYEVALTGEDVKEAFGSEMTDSLNIRSYVVQIALTGEGTAKFADFTKDNLNSTAYIIFDGEVVSNPRILAAIFNGQVYITGLNSLEEAKVLAADIMAGTLPLELELVEYEIIEED